MAIHEIIDPRHRWLQGLSPTRETIVRDAIEHASATGDVPPLIRIAAIDSIPLSDPNCIAVVQPSLHGVGFVVHAGCTGDAVLEDHPAGLVTAMRDRLREVCRDRGLGFIQWATDVLESPSPQSHLPAQLGFERVGTLDYLSVDFPIRLPQSTPVTPDPVAAMVPLASDDADEVARFNALVARTYEGSLDCPTLESYRSVDQIIQGYRDNATYSPDLWFTLVDAQRTVADGAKVHAPIGCLILAKHSGGNDTVMELVYMGVVPEARGRRCGETIMHAIASMAEKCGAARLLLAVDRQNRPASQLYQRLGMRRIFSETVWVQSFEKTE
ncbi:MAG: GNAT family N-acetyltransferase [Planctomycetota bacterium]